MSDISELLLSETQSTELIKLENELLKLSELELELINVFTVLATSVLFMTLISSALVSSLGKTRPRGYLYHLIPMYCPFLVWKVIF